MTRLAMVALALVLPVVVVAQDDISARVAYVRTVYAEIQSSVESFDLVERSFYYADGDGTIKSYRAGAILRKFVVTFDRDGFSSVDEYFFDDSGIVFSFASEETFQIWPDQDPDEFGATENRYYFDPSGKLIRWIVSSHENDMRQRRVPVENEEFRSRADLVRQTMRDWLRFAESDIENFQTFLESGSR